MKVYIVNDSNGNIRVFRSQEDAEEEFKVLFNIYYEDIKDKSCTIEDRLSQGFFSFDCGLFDPEYATVSIEEVEVE